MAKKKFNQELLNEELKKFRLLAEYDFYTGGLDEDDEGDVDIDDLKPVDANAEADDVAAELGVDDANGGDAQDNQAPDASGAPDDAETGDIPDSPASPPPTATPPPPPEEEGVEIDVTELVKTGEETQKSAAIAGHKTDMLLASFNELKQQVAAMTNITNKIDTLEKEIVKRNPTPVEKLEMRSFDSYPYSIKLTDYWADKDDAYDVMDKNSGPEKEYVLTKDDVDAEYNESSVKRSFNNFDEDEI